MSYLGRGRYDVTKPSHRVHTRLSPCVCLQLFAGTSLLVWLAALLVWLAAVEAIRAILYR
jgi:hypothetical protein